MKLIFNFGMILTTLFFLFGCSSFGYQSPGYVKTAHAITANTAKKLEEQKKLYLIGTGGGMMHDIRMMAMGFQFFHEVDLKEARELVVYAVREYLSDINNNEEVRPYLRNYPFTAKNVEIQIWIYNPDGSDPSLEKIYYISAINGVLTYYLDLPKTYSRKAICKETYEEALQKITLNQGSEDVSQTEVRKANEEATIIEVVAKDGAKASISAISLEHSMFQLNGGGFKPYESLNFISSSHHETIHASIKADEKGNILPIDLLPAVIGKSGGVCYISILRNEGSIEIKLPWGTEAIKKR